MSSKRSHFPVVLLLGEVTESLADFAECAIGAKPLALDDPHSTGLGIPRQHIDITERSLTPEGGHRFFQHYLPTECAEFGRHLVVQVMTQTIRSPTDQGPHFSAVEKCRRQVAAKRFPSILKQPLNARRIEQHNGVRFCRQLNQGATKYRQPSAIAPRVPITGLGFRRRLLVPLPPRRERESPQCAGRLRHIQLGKSHKHLIPRCSNGNSSPARRHIGHPLGESRVRLDRKAELLKEGAPEFVTDDQRVPATVFAPARRIRRESGLRVVEKVPLNVDGRWLSKFERLRSCHPQVWIGNPVMTRIVPSTRSTSSAICASR